MFLELLLVLWILPIAPAVSAQSVPRLQVGLYETAADTTAPMVVDQSSISKFHALPAGTLSLHGDRATVQWLQLQMTLPPLADSDPPWVLWLDRACVDRLILHWPAASALPASEPVDYFVPEDNRAVLSNGYAFVLPRGLHGSVTAYLEVAGQGDFSVYPRIRSESEVQDADRSAAILFSAIYTGLILVWLIGLGMYLALRDRLYLYYLAYVGTLIAFLLAVNGHLYELPLLAEWGRWRTLGLYVLSNLLAAATIALARQFAGLAQSAPRLDRALGWMPSIPLALALVCVANQPWLVGSMQIASTIIDLGAVLLAALAASAALHYRRQLALPMLLVWLLLLVGGLLRALVPLGLAPTNFWTLYGYQIAEALSAFLLMIALSDRLIEFRLQRDRARLAKEQVEASLRVEQERRKFVELLHDDVREAPSTDPEWLIFTRLLDTLHQLVPQRSSAVAVHDFHSGDLLICEPASLRHDYQQLLDTRGGAFKGVSRSQLPMQLRIDAPAADGDDLPEVSQFAVLPLPLSVPAWGVLLIERRGGQAFDHDELVLAAEFAQKSALAVEAAASNHAMRLSAEFDALTGAFNRRSVDTQLNARFQQARTHNAPMAVLFVDLDHLKQINDVHGHAAGDHCLRVLADVLSRHCGQAGIFGRYGGDEFVVILPDLDPRHACHWADGMRADAAGRDLEFSTGTMRLSVSVGVASREQADTDVQRLVERADKALYAAKRMGRDQVQVVDGLGAVCGNLDEA